MVRTIKNYYYFKDKYKELGGNLLSEKSWEHLRLDSRDTPFSIPQDRNAWVAKASGSIEIKERAEVIVRILNDLKLTKVFSLGCGCAFLEYNLKRLSRQLFVACSDFSAKSIEILKGVFIECDRIERFDILRGDWNVDDNALYLLHRIDSEFGDTQWKKIFTDMHQAKIKYILFVPCEMLSVGSIIKKNVKSFLYKLQRKPLVFVGYLRTEDSLKMLWEGRYKIMRQLPVGSLQGFLLSRDDNVKKT